MKLTQIQDTLFQAVVGEGALAQAAALVRGGRLAREDRVGIYAEMYWLRMRDSLRADYPLVQKVLGDEDFDVLVARHLKGRPSVHYSLGRLGAGFPQTLREASLELPWLADLAELEWARADAFIAPDGPVLELSALTALTHEAFTHARLVLSPSLRLLKLGWDVLPLWRALEGGAAWRELSVASSESPLVVWRQGLAVFHVGVTTAEHHALSSALQGRELPMVCEAFAEAPEPARAAFQAIASWVSEGMLSALEVNST